VLGACSGEATRAPSELRRLVARGAPTAYAAVPRHGDDERLVSITASEHSARQKFAATTAMYAAKSGLISGSARTGASSFDLRVESRKMGVFPPGSPRELAGRGGELQCYHYQDGHSPHAATQRQRDVGPRQPRPAACVLKAAKWATLGRPHGHDTTLGREPSSSVAPLVSGE